MKEYKVMGYLKDIVPVTLTITAENEAQALLIARYYPAHKDIKRVDRQDQNGYVEFKTEGVIDGELC